MRVDNRNIIRRISKRAFKASRKRNFIAAIAIALTTILFTVLFTMAMSLISSYELTMFKVVGGYCHGTFKEVSEEQIRNISAHRLIKATGERIVVGTLYEGRFTNVGAEISFMDENCSKWSFAEPSTGRMPRDSNEITMDRGALEKLGIAPELGAQIQLTYDTAAASEMSEKITDTFTLVGFWDYDAALPVHYINISREYVENLRERLTAEGVVADFRTDLNVMLRSSNRIEEKMLQVDADLGYDPISRDAENSARIGVNWGYMSSQLANNIDAGSIVGILAFAFLIILTGYLIIYNIFRISVAGDIRFYGLLKTIGTTPRQIKGIIRYQAMLLCAIAIPIGLVTGYLAGMVLTPVLLETTSFESNSVNVSSSPYIFLFATAFSFITVWISCSKPGRQAGKVSPVEAVKYTESDLIAGKRHKTRGAGTFRMALANLGRSKGRTALVMLSIALLVVVLSLLVSFTSGFDMDKYAGRFSSVDFVVGDIGFFNTMVAGDNEASAQIIDGIKERYADSVGGCGYEATGYVMEEEPYERWRASYSGFYSEEEIEMMSESDMTDEGYYRDSVLVEGLDPNLFSKLELVEGDIAPLLDADSHSIAVEVNVDEYGNCIDEEKLPKIGDTVRIIYYDSFDYVDAETGEPLVFEDDVLYKGSEDVQAEQRLNNSREVYYTVAAWVEVPKSIGYRLSYLGCTYVLSKEALEADSARPIKEMFYAFDAKDDDTVAEAEEYLHNLVAQGSTTVKYESRQQTIDDFKDFRNMFMIIGGVLCLVIGLIGALNYVNTITTGVIARQKELAVLRAVGMTGRQLRQMLVYEGLLYTVGAGAVSTVLSVAAMPLIGTLLENMFWFYSRSFRIWPIAVMLPIFALLGIMVPGILYKRFEKQSVVENLQVLS